MSKRTQKLCLEVEIGSVFRAPSHPQVEFSRVTELLVGFWDSEELPTQLLPGPPDHDDWCDTLRCWAPPSLPSFGA